MWRADNVCTSRASEEELAGSTGRHSLRTFLAANVSARPRASYTRAEESLRTAAMPPAAFWPGPVHNAATMHRGEPDIWVATPEAAPVAVPHVVGFDHCPSRPSDFVERTKKRICRGTNVYCFMARNLRIVRGSHVMKKSARRELETPRGIDDFAGGLCAGNSSTASRAICMVRLAEPPLR